MNALMYSQMGLSLVQGLGQYQSASIQAKLQQRIIDYRNTMSRISAARSLNAVTVNEARTRDTAVQSDVMIQQQAIQDQSRQVVDAAAAGVAGNSVDMIAKDLRASAGMAGFAQKRKLHQQMAEMGAQRQSIAIGAITNEDVQVVPKPSIGAMLLGAGANLLDIYDSHQPEGSRLLGYNGGRVNDRQRL